MSNINLHLGDHMPAMREMPNYAFSLLDADPPYGIDGNSHRKNKSRGKLARSTDYHSALWGQPQPEDEYFDQAFRVSRN